MYRISAVGARWAHNPKVDGSNPSSDIRFHTATILKNLATSNETSKTMGLYFNGRMGALGAPDLGSIPSSPLYYEYC